MDSRELFVRKHYHKIDFVSILRKISTDDNFSFSRFNDGEMVAIFKSLQLDPRMIAHNANMDNHQYFGSMGIELSLALKHSDANYLKQSSTGYTRKEWYLKCFQKFVADHSKDLKLVSNDMFHQALRESPDTFRYFIDLLNKSQREIILVGGNYLEKLNWLNWKTLVQVPRTDCYLKRHEILEYIKNALATYPQPPATPKSKIVLFSASMTSNILIHELHLLYGSKHTFIDVGSLWDVFFFDSNKDINQRSPIKRDIDKFRSFYPDFFI